MLTAEFESLASQIDGDLARTPIDRCMLATDASIFSIRPEAVVYPRHTRDVVATLEFARCHGLSVHPRGAGSGLCGSALGRGMVVDFTRHMNRLIRIDRDAKTVECEPGYRLGEMDAALAGSGLFFPPDPSSGEYASLGGMVATNASGAHAVKYGNVADYLMDAEVVLASGQMVSLAALSTIPMGELPDPFGRLAQCYLDHRETIETGYPAVSHNVAGYNLRGLVKDGRLHLQHLFCGAEGTLGIATRLKFRLMDKPAHDSLVVAFFDTIHKAARAVQAILPMQPAGIEVMDKSLLELARASDPLLGRRIPAGIDNVLMVEFDGRRSEETEALGRQVLALLAARELTNDAHLAISSQEKARFWSIRKAAVPILYKLKGEKKILALIEDAVVPTDRLVDYFTGIYSLLNQHQVRFVVYGHIAKGLLHTRPLLNLKDPADVGLLKTLADGVFDLVSGLGGVVSGEHGDGRLRSAYVRRQYPALFPLFRETKRLLDPDNLLNPEIKTASTADQMMRHLRYGTGYRPQDSTGRCLNWPSGWQAAIERCHGCTKCTTVTTATRMCPIYKFTRQEAAAPKAKANVLRALISGALDDGALYQKAFQAVIDQCVGCGSCRLECPSNVDIPKLALEARAAYVRRFGPTLHSRLVTGVETLGRYGGRLSGGLAPVMRFAFARRAGELLTGVSRHRPFVAMARESLFRQVPQVAGSGGKRVIYFSGCYAGYIRPDIGRALVRTLTRLGMTVYTPAQHCCGLPLLTKGMADEAREKVRRNLARWGDLLSRVDYVVVTCSSCGLALLQEWGYLLNTPLIRQVADKVIHFSRLVQPAMAAAGMRPVNLSAAYHQPCHLKIQPDPQCTASLMGSVPGLTLATLKSHCCGMAGTWGLAAKNESLSRTIGNHLMSLIDSSGADVAVTDCPTCEMQMAQLGGRPVMHPVEIAARCLDGIS
ncbi:FAD-dependent oxidoreductase [Desulfosarcina ovata subsp. sediminis]|uniref:D-lactate dehydrogenase (cytochrome) n=1 Tax=Desulfosarcina ovata subsp. sediminis TaxID=885957 RepID=A0A5K7ZEJ0_9BACT|nr:FAD-binding and (Fe-S)-binding domain-containing protein [Desulfosarcina ovata]BBO80472.1 FAD-dependent oxidoreductase [Desulfosarcina ovata subsp. sediminis]